MSVLLRVVGPRTSEIKKGRPIVASKCPYSDKSGNCAGTSYDYHDPCGFKSPEYEHCTLYVSIKTALSGGTMKDRLKRAGFACPGGGGNTTGGDQNIPPKPPTGVR